MLFTPVPGTHIYRQHQDYLHNIQGWNLQDLNGKFFPFLEYNRQNYPELRASDYLRLEALMSILNNGKVLSRAIDLCDDSQASRAFREVLSDKAGTPTKVHFPALEQHAPHRTTQQISLFEQNSNLSIDKN